jgi:hypothetical protein
MSESVITAVQATILPADETSPSPLQQSLSTIAGSDGNSLSHQVSKNKEKKKKLIIKKKKKEKRKN